MRSAIVYERAGVPLLILRTAQLSLAEETIAAAAAELFARRVTTQHGDFSASYLLGVEEDPGRFPASAALVQLLREDIVEGPHLDSHPGIAPGTELLRLLVNLGSRRRLFQYFRTDVYELQAGGVRVGRTDFEPLALAGDIPPATVDIPGRTSDHVDFLQFWASVVPHVGINEPTGSFLASFEALAALPGAGGREP